MFSTIELPSTKTLVSTAASVAATAMLVRSLAKDVVPPELSQYFFTKVHNFLATFSNDMTITIEEFDGIARNQLFTDAEIYLGTKISPSTKRFKASIPEKQQNIQVSMGGNEDLTDTFHGMQLKWRVVHRQQNQPRHVRYDDYHSTMQVEFKYLELTFHKKHKNKVLDEYLPYIVERSKVAKQEKRTLKLHTLGSDGFHQYPPKTPWKSVNLDHPATFETLAMDDDMKNMIIDDLDRFVKRKDFYRKVGKAWKRGYLLFGPPGTGKSSLIAAMANYLKFDVYDLELTDLRSNSDLRRLLLWTANRSILVVEDIDASMDLSERKTIKPQRRFSHHDDQIQVPKVTLSGLLNFTDGLWSSCGDERIIIFTTNHIDKLDEALLRPGRMDVHIHMSYCTPRGLKMLATNYLGDVDHPLLSGAEKLIGETKVTPAEVAEQLLKSDDPDRALQGLIEFLEHKKESDKLKGENLEETTKEVQIAEENEDDNEVLKNDAGQNGFKVLTNVTPAEARDQVLKNGEAMKALKVLIGLLGAENGIKDVKDSDSGFRASEVVCVPESGKAEETHAE